MNAKLCSLKYEYGRYADFKNSSDNVSFKMKSVAGELYLEVFRVVENDSDDERDYLTEDCSDSRAFSSHCGESEVAEDEHGVENYIDYRADTLGEHREKRSSRRLHETLKENLAEDTEGEHTAYRKIFTAALDYVSGSRLERNEPSGEEQTEHEKDEISEKCENKSVSGAPVCSFVVFLAE